MGQKKIGAGFYSDPYLFYTVRYNYYCYFRIPNNFRVNIKLP
jgi:hypothetical protein